ncbi:PAS domain-containing protein [Shouchella patagoniensis]|uniref:PAS domain-containing protein n=1 Tax=Shouchella patagoniensis TaxID=228576 RepID=UPI000995BEF3|nr:STAS domain-containing protein [Shouchella patagoniensis]
MLDKIIKQAELLMKVLDYTRVGVLVTDPDQEDNPIVYMSEGFTKMTGYSKEEVLGKNCRFLQGEDTDRKQITLIKEAIAKKEPVLVEILNYTKDGHRFWNELTIDPVYLEEEDKLYFVGVQREITKQKLAEKEYKQSVQQIRSISTPIVPLLDGLAVLPLVGEMNKERFDLMFDSVTSNAVKLSIKQLLIDVSGLTEYDAFIVEGIYQLRDVLRLIGTELIVCGMSSELAMQAVTIDGNKLDSIRTSRSVQQILTEAFEVSAKK